MRFLLARLHGLFLIQYLLFLLNPALAIRQQYHRWVVWADEVEQERLRAYHQRAIENEFRQRWTQTPLADHS